MTVDGSAVGAYWAHRADSELRASRLFAQLAVDLRAAGADDAVLSLADRAVRDEREHARTCRAVASHYGRAIEEPGIEDGSPASAATADPALHAAQNATAFCCIQETIACAWLDECLRGATEPMVREALRAMLSDETHHARLGWAHLASTRVSPETRRKIEPLLPAMVEACIASWLDPEVSRLAVGAREHGVPSPEDTRRVVLGAIRSVVVPGFASLGMSR